MRALLAALLLAPPACWSAPARSRPQGLRPGSPTDGEPLCRDLRPHARRLRWGFPDSQPNHLNCGAGEGEPSNYVLPTDPEQPYELHVVSVHQGSFPVQTGDPAAPEDSVQVVVYKTRKPAVLALSGRDGVLWDVTVTPEANLELVIVQGRGRQMLRGVPEEIPVLRRSWEQACAYAHAWEPRRNLAGPDLPLLISSLRCSTGLRESSFQGCTEGALFEVPHYRQTPAAATVRWERPCPLPVDPDVPLPRRRQASRAERLDPMEAPATPPRLREPEPATPPRSEPSRVVDPFARLGGGPEPLAPPRGAVPRADEPVDAEPRREAPPAAAPEAKQEPLEPVTGTKERLPAPEAPPAREDIPVRALAILLRGDRTLLTHDAVPDLVVALKKGDETLRWRAADALGQLGPQAAGAVEPLLGSLREESWRVRSSAALALGNIGAEPKKCSKRLRRLLRDRHPDVRHSAKTALERLAAPEKTR